MSEKPSPNPVLASTAGLLDNLQHVQIHDGAIHQLAEKWALQNWYVPDWNFPEHLKGIDERAAEYLILGNSINFAYTDFGTKEEFVTEYEGQKYPHARGMWAALQRAVREQGDYILQGDFLRLVTREQMAKIFTGAPPMPLLDERVRVWNEMGRVLCQKYDGRLINVVKASHGKLFDSGNGLVERLSADFSTFDDSVNIDGQRYIFNKRAQLAAGMLRGRYQNNPEGAFRVADEEINQLTLYADYFIPWVLTQPEEGMDGVLQFSEEFQEKIRGGQRFTHRDREIVEMRATTVHSGDRITRVMNEIRKAAGLPPLSAALHLDPKLWFMGCQKQERQKEMGQSDPHPLVETIYF